MSGVGCVGTPANIIASRSGEAAYVRQRTEIEAALAHRCSIHTPPSHHQDCMKHNGTRGPVDSHGMTATPFADIDAIAAASLSSQSLVRYHAYKEVLLAREQDHAAVISTLTLFVSDLCESR
jgi:hypothetical protein